MRGKNVSSQTIKDSANFQAGFEFGVLYANTKAKLNAIGETGGISVSVAGLAGRMAALLSAEAGGSVLDRTERMLSLWRNPAEGTEVSTSPEEIHVRPHDDKPRRTMSKAARQRIAAAQHARWAKWKAKNAKNAKKPLLVVTKKKKRKVSPKTLAILRRNIKIAQAARWANKKAA